MTVYVDQVFEATPRDPQARSCGTRWCHMMADTPEELHEFAARIGMRRSWAQNEGTPRVHYDLTPNRRAAAIRLGAKSVSWREMPYFQRLKTSSNGPTLLKAIELYKKAMGLEEEQ